jgi:hypothetical protein
VAAGGAVVTTAGAPSHHAGHQPDAGIASWDVLRANNASTTACVPSVTMSIPTGGGAVFDETFFQTSLPEHIKAKGAESADPPSVHVKLRNGQA